MGAVVGFEDRVVLDANVAIQIQGSFAENASVADSFLGKIST